MGLPLRVTPAATSSSSVPANRVQAIFARLRAERGKALMPFVCGGFPRPGRLGEILTAVHDAGAAIVEVGIPFSDPIADGPVIAAAMHEALEAGSTPHTVLGEVRAFRTGAAEPLGTIVDPIAREMLGAGRPQAGDDRSQQLGLVAMVSVSIVHRIGSDAIRAKREAGVKAGAFVPGAAALAFCRLVADSGFDGLIVPDCPLDEASDLTQAAGDAGLTMSHLIAPSTSPERAERIAKASTGFVYVLARAGITGESQQLPEIGGRLARIREMTDLPIAVGFGVSSAEQVRHVVKHADAAIVGSALVRRMASAGPSGVVQAAAQFTRELSAGLR